MGSREGERAGSGHFRTDCKNPRFSPVETAFTVVLPGGARRAIAELPVAALRLTPAVCDTLHRLGLRRISDLIALPRAPLAARFGGDSLRRLDQALGREDEPISPRHPVPTYLARRIFNQPITETERLPLRMLLDELCHRLEADRRGLRQAHLTLFRVDGAGRRLTVGTARATRDAAHLARLLATRLEGFQCGFGVEAMTLAAGQTECQPTVQPALLGAPGEEASLAALVDRLANRLGPGRVFRMVARASHVPERAVVRIPAMAPPVASSWRREICRPPRLFPRPESIEATAMVPDAPPVRFRWRGRAYRVVHASGPERLAAEWWHMAAFDSHDYRDYYRLEDTDGTRFWVYRQGPYGGDRQAAWYMHGLFA